MKKNNDKKKTIILAGIGLFTVLGGTLAYFTTSSNIVNKFESGLYQNRIVEEFESPNNWVPGTTTKKEVRVENTGDVSMALRASVSEEWINKKGDKISLIDDKGNIAAIVNYGDAWKKGSDGYFYYKDGNNLKELLPGNTSDNFIESVTFNGNIEASLKKEVSEDGKTITYTSTGEGYDDATYSLVVTIDTVQFDHASSAWNI